MVEMMYILLILFLYHIEVYLFYHYQNMQLKVKQYYKVASYIDSTTDEGDFHQCHDLHHFDVKD